VGKNKGANKHMVTVLEGISLANNTIAKKTLMFLRNVVLTKLQGKTVSVSGLTNWLWFMPRCHTI
jgi:hypothetical protein